MHSFTAIVLGGLVSLVAAQNGTQGVYYINPDSVSSSTRESWCNAQTSTCPLICLQTMGNTLTPQNNTCDADDLTYSCICSNGVSPNATEYSQTLPYFICSEWGNQCVANCGSGQSSCAAACRDNHPCGAQNPIRVNTSTITTMSKTASGGATNSAGQTIYTGFGGSAASETASGKSGAVPAMDMGCAYGGAVVAAGVLGGFALLI